MKNKVLIKLIVPEIDNVFDLFIPTNELIWKIKKLVIKSINDLIGDSLNMNANYILINKLKGKKILSRVIYSDKRDINDLQSECLDLKIIFVNFLEKE